MPPQWFDQALRLACAASKPGSVTLPREPGAQQSKGRLVLDIFLAILPVPQRIQMLRVV